MLSASYGQTSPRVVVSQGPAGTAPGGCPLSVWGQLSLTTDLTLTWQWSGALCLPPSPGLSLGATSLPETQVGPASGSQLSKVSLSSQRWH